MAGLYPFWRTMRFIGKLILAALAVGVAIQFIRPKIEIPPVTAELAAPEEVRAILKNSCYDCHSNETRLKWFDEPAPMYWLVAHDVKEARRHLNFSEIGRLPAAAQRGMLFEAVNLIRLGSMPLPSYRQAHPGTTVTPEQLAVLEKYLAPFGDAGIVSPTAAQGVGPAQGEIPGIAASQAGIPTVEAEPNGLAFLSGYQTWKPISTTDRGDNHTLRVILGNDVAVQAIAAKKIMPWPDGAAFAKVAWEAVPDGSGGLQAGRFLQVEFMVKDAQKYASTAGWGWGRWRGLDLKPYGKDGQFTNECVGCHLPVRGNDFVYSTPVERGGL
jgi:heme-binding protein/cytochrome P460